MNWKWQHLVALVVVCVALLGAVLISANLLVGGAAGTSSKATLGETALISQLNVQRKRFGLVKLKVDPLMATVAGAHSRDMVALNYFAHDEPGGRTYEQRVARVHRREVAENIAWGTGAMSAKTIVSLWMHSPEHRKIILTRVLRLIGVSIVHGRFKGNASAVVVTAEFST